MKVLLAYCFLIAAVAASNAEEASPIEECFEKDSISCVQLTIFRRVKAFFEQPTIDLIEGMSLTKSAEVRQPKAIEDSSFAVEAAKSVEDRSLHIQSYISNQLYNLMKERSFNLNFANAARSISNAIPDDMKAELRGLVEEGRLKKRKLLKKIAPILMGLKVKVLALAVLALFGLLFIAKKALFVSFIALALSLFSGLSSLAQKSGSGLGGGLFSGLGSLFGGSSAGIGSYSAGSTGWSGNNAGYSSGGGWSGGSGSFDSHGSYSSPVAQTVAYSGHKQSLR